MTPDDICKGLSIAVQWPVAACVFFVLGCVLGYFAANREIKALKAEKDTVDKHLNYIREQHSIAEGCLSEAKQQLAAAREEIETVKKKRLPLDIQVNDIATRVDNIESILEDVTTANTNVTVALGATGIATAAVSLGAPTLVITDHDKSP